VNRGLCGAAGAWSRLAFVAWMGAFTAGCAGIRLGDPSVRSPRRGDLSLRWHRRLTEPAALDWASLVRGGVAHDAVRDRVFVGAADQGLRAFRASDGALLWRFEALGRVDSTPMLDGDTLVFGASDGAIYSVNSERGSLRWRTSVGAEVVHAPTRVGRWIVVVTGADAVAALDAETGVRGWTYRRSAPGGISSSGHAGLTVRDGRIFTGFSDGTAVALDGSDGSVIWEQDTAAEFESAEGQNEGHQAIDIDTTPVVLGDSVFVASQAVGLLALDALGGARRWTASAITGVTALGTDGDALLVSSVEQGLIRIDPFDGRPIWSRDLESRAIVNIQPLGRGRMLATSADAGMWVVSIGDGAIRDGLRPGRGIAAPVLSTADSRLFVHSNADVLYALEVR
jgi:outer membrane protein assembly factor BamB